MGKCMLFELFFLFVPCVFVWECFAGWAKRASGYCHLYDARAHVILHNEPLCGCTTRYLIFENRHFCGWFFYTIHSHSDTFFLLKVDKMSSIIMDHFSNSKHSHKCDGFEAKRKNILSTEKLHVIWKCIHMRVDDSKCVQREKKTR